MRLFSAFSPALKIKTVDTTGAGDGFIGSLLWKMHNLGITLMIEDLTNDKLLSCLEFANKFISDFKRKLKKLRLRA